MLKILQVRLQWFGNQELQMYKVGLEKAEEPEIKLPTLGGSHRKGKEIPEKHLFCFPEYAKAFDCVVVGGLVTKSCLTLVTPWAIAYQARLSLAWGFSGKNTRVGYHFLLQGIFLTQELNPDLLHCRQVLCLLSHQGSPGKG